MKESAQTELEQLEDSRLRRVEELPPSRTANEMTSCEQGVDFSQAPRIPAATAPVNGDASADNGIGIREKVLEVLRKEFPPPGKATPIDKSTVSPLPPSPTHLPVASPDTIPARMLNEFVYCQRLFYYEFVEGVFVESADTVRGDAIHQRVDSGNGAMPAAKTKPAQKAADKPIGATFESGEKGEETPGKEAAAEPETIHSRSVQMGSDRLGVVAKMDLVEVRTGDDLFAALDVCPVDYKAGAPKEGADANELWDTDKMQLGLQALILRDNGYTCNQGVI